MAAAADVAPGGRRPGRVARLSHGFLSVPRGVGFVAARPRLYPWLLASLPLTCLVMVGLVAAAWRVQSEVAGWALAGWEGWLWGSLAWSISLGGWLIILAAAWLVFAEVGKLVCLPFSEVISRRVEAERTDGLPGESTAGLVRAGVAVGREVSVGMLHGLLLLPVKIAILVALLPLVVVPVVGPMIWWGLPGALFHAFDFLDLPTARRGYSFGEKLSFLQRHGYEALGLGLGVCLIIAIPILNLVLLPAAAAGATLLYLELEPN